MLKKTQVDCRAMLARLSNIVTTEEQMHLLLSDGLSGDICLGSRGEVRVGSEGLGCSNWLSRGVSASVRLESVVEVFFDHWGQVLLRLVDLLIELLLLWNDARLVSFKVAVVSASRAIVSLNGGLEV